ncbi:hypothetical protein [Demequina subtropica]|uniref:hypothetical protein n=1 Tax=Demequina subtropica TaxID=1638989 RepID=UPI000781FCA2|nr:hypothetical protein [Demequina subtropica]
MLIDDPVLLHHAHRLARAALAERAASPRAPRPRPFAALNRRILAFEVAALARALARAREAEVRSRRTSMPTRGIPHR